MANDINSGSYAQYEGFDSISYDCIKYLMDNDELIWKLLAYSTPDAWNKANLSQEEKAALIYTGQDDASLFKVFMDDGNPDAFTQEGCLIRIHPYTLNPDNRVWGSVTVMFSVFSNFHANHLSNYKTRNHVIVQRFIQVFNGINVPHADNPNTSIGKLHFDAMGTFGLRMDSQGQLPWRGSWVLMGQKSN